MAGLRGGREMGAGEAERKGGADCNTVPQRRKDVESRQGRLQRAGGMEKRVGRREI